MNLLSKFQAEALRRGLIQADDPLDARTVFALVRDMPYRRAADRLPETIIAAWHGTCSGKHYLLQALFAELGLSSTLMACTVITPIPEEQVAEEARPFWEAANRRFVDVHNYLVVHHPEGEMIVDATWPLNTPNQISINDFIPGQNQNLAGEPAQSWPVPPDEDPQVFKNALLNAHFTPDELHFRELVITYLSGDG